MNKSLLIVIASASTLMLSTGTFGNEKSTDKQSADETENAQSIVDWEPYLLRSNSRDNPDALPTSVKMEMSLRTLLGEASEYGLSDEDIDVLSMSNRGTSEGARKYDETVPTKAEAELQRMCGYMESLGSEARGKVENIVEYVNRSEMYEEESAVNYWLNVVSSLSENGQQAYSTVSSSLLSTGRIGIGHSQLNWVGFSRAYPDLAIGMLQEGCEKVNTLQNTPKVYDPEYRIIGGDK